MIFSNFVLISSAFLVIITIQHVSTDCVDLISETSLFKRGQVNKVVNFMQAYKFLSLSQIDQYLNFDPSDSTKTILRKSTKWKLMKEYFLDLMSRRNLDFNKMKGPELWCESKTLEAVTKGKIEDTYQFAYNYQTCLEYTNGYLLNNAPELRLPASVAMPAIFKILYQNWSLPFLTKHIYITRNSEHMRPIDRERKAKYIETFSLGYFTYMSEYVDDRRHNTIGSFRSIENYCRSDGNRLVISIQNQYKEANRSTPPE